MSLITNQSIPEWIKKNVLQKNDFKYEKRPQQIVAFDQHADETGLHQML